MIAPGQPAVALPARNRTNVKLAIVLIAIVAGGVVGYLAYDRLWVNNPVWNAAVDQPFASRAVDNLDPICSNGGNDRIANPTNPTTWYVLGIRNTSGYSMDTGWTIAFNDPTVSVFVSSTRTFHIAGSGNAYPKFQWTLNSTQVMAQQSDTDIAHNLIVSMDRTFNVTGYHGSYHFTRYDAGTSAVHGGFLAVPIGGDIGKVLGPPTCSDSVVLS